MQSSITICLLVKVSVNDVLYFFFFSGEEGMIYCLSVAVLQIMQGREEEQEEES